MAGIIEKITISTTDPSILLQTFHSLKLMSKPYFMEINVLSSDQIKVVHLLERFLLDNNFQSIIYPIYLLDIKKEFNSGLHLRSVTKFSDVPEFYRKKNKVLSNKESKIQERIDLKLLKLKNINLVEKNKSIVQYAKIHRKLRELCEYGAFCEKILKLNLD